MRLLVTIAAVLLLAGCGSSSQDKPVAQASTAPTTPAVTTPPAAQSYQTVEALRDAAVEWGLSCDAWDGTGASDLRAAQSGTCTAAVGDTADLLATYATPADLQADLAYLRGLVFPGEQLNMLVGPNWMISTDSTWATRLQAKLGGTIER